MQGIVICEIGFCRKNKILIAKTIKYANINENTHHPSIFHIYPFTYSRGRPNIPRS